MSTQSNPMSLDENIEDSLSDSKANDFFGVNSCTLGDLRSIDEIHPKYRHIFQYPFFNKIQSKILNDVLYTDKSIVVSAPTGSGKTVILELAIVRLLMKLNELKYKGDFKIVYMAPVKALCSERLSDWYGKFSKLGLPCIEVTGDTDSLDFSQLKYYRIIMTTPEKWDSLTRRWKDHKLIVQMVKLFIIDEVHLLNEDVRGPVLEAVVSRMKTIQASISLSIYAKRNKVTHSTNSCGFDNETGMDLDEDVKSDQIPIDIRFIAVSATIPNAEDIAEWLGTRDHPAACFKIGEEYRPVKLIKIVEGFPCKDGQSLFKFDMYLSYKLRPIIERYCDGKPTIIFCNTRKSVVMTAEVLSRELMFQFSREQSAVFSQMSSRLSEKKLQVLVKSGIGCHHAGFLQQDRNIIEQMFRQGYLPLLITTSTLAMGVNLPAHLVILKTTQFYNNGSYQEYEESTILQMMGRAGRPQFDTEGVAVIMTRCQDRERYTRLCGGKRAVESALHRHLAEHLNAEAALGTLTDLLQAMDWIRSTFLYVRAVRNPAHYGYPAHIGRDTIEKRLEELCLKCVNALARAGMLTMDSDTGIVSTEAGALMAAHCLDFETMKIILKIRGTESLSDLLTVLSTCHEYSDLPLRTGEKRCLNLLNRRPRGQSAGGLSCRFPLPGRIQTREMKVNCLIQAVFGCLPIPDPSLQQETGKVLRTGEHISKCIVTYVTRTSAMASPRPIYQGVLNSVILAKCFSARLWDNSCYVVRQLTGIGPTFASLLASAGKTTFESIRLSNPRDLERIMNKLPPSGNILKKQVMMLPLYEVELRAEPSRTTTVILSIKNRELFTKESATTGGKHKVTLIIGDSENNLLLFENIADSSLLETANAQMTRKITPKCSSAHTMFAHCISNTWVGLDVQTSIKMKSSLINVLPGAFKNNIQEYVGKNKNFFIKKKDDCETLEESEAVADFTSQIQREFMDEENDIRCVANQTHSEEKITVTDKPKRIAVIKKTPVKKDVDFKNNHKNSIMQKISNYIKSTKTPYPNTLSSNTIYYKLLPKTVKQNNSDQNLNSTKDAFAESTELSKLKTISNDNDTNFSESNFRLPSILKNSTSSDKCIGDNFQTQQMYHKQTLHINLSEPESNSDKNPKTYFHNNIVREHNGKSQTYYKDCINTISPEQYNIDKNREMVEFECTPIIEDILNNRDDESFEIWCKKLDTQNTNEFSTLKIPNFSSETDQWFETEKEDYKNLSMKPTTSKIFPAQTCKFKQHNDLIKHSTGNKNVAKPSENSKTFMNENNTQYNETKSENDLCNETYHLNSIAMAPQNEMQQIKHQQQTKQMYHKQKLHINEQESNSDKNTKTYFHNNTLEKHNGNSQTYYNDCINTVSPEHYNIHKNRESVEYECTPVIEDILNNRDDESFDIWCKKLEFQDTNDISPLMLPNFPLVTDQWSETEKEDYKNKNIDTQSKPRIVKKCAKPTTSKLFSTQAYMFKQHNDLIRHSNYNVNVAKPSKNSKTFVYEYNTQNSKTKNDNDLCDEIHHLNSITMSPQNEALDYPSNRDDSKIIDNSLINLTIYTENCKSSRNINNNIKKLNKTESYTENFKSNGLQEIKSIESNTTTRKELGIQRESHAEIENILSTHKIAMYQPNAETQVVANTKVNKISLMRKYKIEDLSYEQNIGPTKCSVVMCEPKTKASEKECKVLRNETEYHKEPGNPLINPERITILPNEVPFCVNPTALHTSKCFGNDTMYDKSCDNLTLENMTRKTFTGVEGEKYGSASFKSLEKPSNESLRNVFDLKTNQCDLITNIFTKDIVKNKKPAERDEKGGDLSISFNIQNDARINIMDKYCHKLYSIAFNMVHRPFSFETLRKRENCKKIRFVTWRNPLVLPTNINFINSEKYSEESQIHQLCSVRKNLSLIERNKIIKSVPPSLMAVIKSIIELPVENLLSIYYFLKVNSTNFLSFDGYTQMSLSNNRSKMCYNTSLNEIMHLDDQLTIEEVESNGSNLEDIQMLDLLQKNNDKPLEKNVTKFNNVYRSETKITEINVVEVENKVVHIPQQLCVSNRVQNTEHNDFCRNNKIFNKEIFVREWLNKSPFHTLPDLNLEKGEENTQTCEELKTKNAEKEKTITNTSNTSIMKEKGSTKENHFGSLLEAILFKHESKFHSEKPINKINNFDLGVEDLLEMTKDNENENPPERKLGPIESDGSRNENKSTMNTVSNPNDEDIFHLYRNSSNSNEIAKYSPDSEGINQNINKISDQYSSENNLNSCLPRLGTGGDDSPTPESVKKGWIRKSEHKYTYKNVFDSDDNDSMDENMLDPQIVLSSAYCNDKATNDSPFLDLEKGNNIIKNSYDFPYKLFEGKNMDNIEHSLPLSKNNSYSSDVNFVYDDNSLNKLLFPSRIKLITNKYTTLQGYDNNTNHLQKRSPRSTEKIHKKVKRKNIGVSSEEQIKFPNMKYWNIYGNQKMQSQIPLKIKPNQTFYGKSNYRQKYRREQKKENTSGERFLSQFQMIPKTKLHHP